MLILLQIIIAALGITAGSYVDNNVSHAQVAQALRETSSCRCQVYPMQMLAPQHTDGSLSLCSSGILYRETSSSNPKLIPWRSVAQWEVTAPPKADGAADPPMDLKVTTLTTVAFKDDHYDFQIQGTPSEKCRLTQSLEHYHAADGAG